ncbi:MULTISPECIES: VOC family protein [Bradyrhizobium]|uniref:VOC family protein n=1 Tax=Bradyrhizobium TaxID=374 RepID=UPI001FCEEEEC|nr:MULTISPECIES: VOC family protein [Bradyrhizobium]
MTDEHPMMAGSATVFVVSDIAASLAYYRDVLGFEVTFEYGVRPCPMPASAATLSLCICLQRPGRNDCPGRAASAFSSATSTSSMPNCPAVAPGHQPAGGSRLRHARFRHR